MGPGALLPSVSTWRDSQRPDSNRHLAGLEPVRPVAEATEGGSAAPIG